MRTINCNECNRHLFDTELEGDGKVGHLAQTKGFVFKNSGLFTGVSKWLYFCNKECNNAYYGKNVPSNPEVTALIKKLKSEIPQRAAECAKGMAAIQEQFKKY